MKKREAVACKYQGILEFVYSPFVFTSFENRQHIVIYINDPSAGSPTETLLRLLVPPNHQV